MKKEINLDEVVELLKKVQVTPDLVTGKEKRALKKYLDDPKVFLQAVGRMGGLSEVSQSNVKPEIEAGTEEKIAQDYISLSYYVVDRMRDSGIKGLDEITGLSAQIGEDTLQIFALTPQPVELDFARYVLSDAPMCKEMMMEMESLLSDIIIFGDKEASFAKIKQLIDAEIPD